MILLCEDPQRPEREEEAVYENSFGLLPHESMWQEYERDQWGLDPRRKRTAKGCPVSTWIPIEIDEDGNEHESRKKCEIC